VIRHTPRVDEAVVEPSGWFSVQLRYAYLVGEPAAASLVEDRVILVQAADEEGALGHAVERAPDYEDEFETEESESGVIRFQGIVAIKELDDGPQNGTEVWHEFMSPEPGLATDDDGDPLPTVWPQEMAFPRASDD
jgi:Domain of unknown function (DUF4288)